MMARQPLSCKCVSAPGIACRQQRAQRPSQDAVDPAEEERKSASERKGKGGRGCSVRDLGQAMGELEAAVEMQLAERRRQILAVRPRQSLPVPAPASASDIA